MKRTIRDEDGNEAFLTPPVRIFAEALLRATAIGVERDLEEKPERCGEFAHCGRNVSFTVRVNLDGIAHGVAELRVAPMAAIEIENGLSRSGDVVSRENAQVPWCRPRSAFEQSARSSREFVEPRGRYDESPKKVAIVAGAILRVIPDGGVHFQAGRRKQARVIHNPGEK